MNMNLQLHQVKLDVTPNANRKLSAPVCSDLNAGQGIAINVVMLDQTSSFAEDVNPSLMTVEDIVPSDCRVAEQTNMHQIK